MTLPRPTAPEAESIGTLFSRLKEDGIRVARAEAEYYKQLGLARFNGIKVALILVVLAIFLAGSALTTLLIGIGMMIGHLIGPAAGIAVAGLLGLALAGLLAFLASKRFGAPPISAEKLP